MSNQRYREPRQVESFGMILCSRVNGEVKYGLVKRRYCYGLRKMLNCDFSNARYFEQVSNTEREALLHVCEMRDGYEDVFTNLWSMITYNRIDHKEVSFALAKFLRNRQIIQTRINAVQSVYPDGIWFFPKGRKERKENDLECALREVQEETTLNTRNIQVLPIGIQTDTYNSQWNSKYFVGVVNQIYAQDKSISSCEIERIEWLNIEDTQQRISNDMTGIRNIVRNIDYQVNTMIKV